MTVRDTVRHLFRRDRRAPGGLLDGVRPEDRPHLAQLLTAAAGPARPEELAGEDDARAAFRAARDRWPDPPVAPHRRLALVVAAAVVALLLGGTAYAAGTGRLPGPAQRTADGFLGVEPRATVAGSTPGARATSPAPPAPTVDPGRPVDPTVLTALCRTWAATAGNPHAKALTPEELRTLEAAAGGSARIGPFCERLTGRPNATPAPTATTGRPGNAPPNTRRPSNAGKPADN